MITEVTEDYVSFETAKLLNEKEFNEYCRTYYTNSRIGFHDIYNSPRLIDNKSLFEMGLGLSAPTLQMAMKWLREVHNTDICVCRELDEYDDCFDGFIAVVYSNKVYKVTIRDVEIDLSYEEAAESAIKYCLENLI